MAQVIFFSGSPTPKSRTTAVLDYAKTVIEGAGISTVIKTIQDVPAEDLLYADFKSPELQDVQKSLDEATGVVICTPVYKASYPGGLKAMLDLMPQYGLSGKTVLPIATGGTLNHLLAIDYAMKPLFSVMGATDILRGVFILSSQIQFDEAGHIQLGSELKERLDESLQELAARSR